MPVHIIFVYSTVTYWTKHQLKLHPKLARLLHDNYLIPDRYLPALVGRSTRLESAHVDPTEAQVGAPLDPRHSRDTHRVESRVRRLLTSLRRCRMPFSVHRHTQAPCDGCDQRKHDVTLNVSLISGSNYDVQHDTVL